MNSELKPKIRFKGFTDDWEQRKLGDEAIELIAGGDIDKAKLLENGKYPIYANALTNEGLIGYYNSYFRVKAPAVTITGRGEIGHAIARNIDFTPVVRLLSIKSKHNNIFLANAINQVKVVSESTGVPQLTVPQVEKYEINFPIEISEENKIGEFFTNLDNLITLHQRKCDKLVELKKSLLEKMFPQNNSVVPEIRFKGFTNDWEQRKLEEIVDFYRGHGLSWNDISEDGVNKCVLYGNLYTDYGMVINEVLRATNCNKMDCFLSEVGDVLIPSSDTTPTGLARASSLNLEGIILGGDINVLRPKTVNGTFLSYLINNNKNELIKRIKGTTVRHLNNSDIKDMDLYISNNLNEQVKIADLLSSLDNLITLHQCKYDKLNKIRQSLLNDMFI